MSDSKDSKNTDQLPMTSTNINHDDAPGFEINTRKSKSPKELYEYLAWIEGKLRDNPEIGILDLKPHTIRTALGGNYGKAEAAYQAYLDYESNTPDVVRNLDFGQKLTSLVSDLVVYLEWQVKLQYASVLAAQTQDLADDIESLKQSQKQKHDENQQLISSVESLKAMHAEIEKSYRLSQENVELLRNNILELTTENASKTEKLNSANEKLAVQRERISLRESEITSLFEQLNSLRDEYNQILLINSSLKNDLELSISKNNSQNDKLAKIEKHNEEISNHNKMLEKTIAEQKAICETLNNKYNIIKIDLTKKEQAIAELNNMLSKESIARETAEKAIIINQDNYSKLEKNNTKLTDEINIITKNNSTLNDQIIDFKIEIKAMEKAMSMISTIGKNNDKK